MVNGPHSPVHTHTFKFNFCFFTTFNFKTFCRHAHPYLFLHGQLPLGKNRLVRSKKKTETRMTQYFEISKHMHCLILEAFPCV